MYTSHAYNFKNSKDFTCVGDPYLKKRVVMPRHTNKQFQTAPPKKGQTAGYFHKMTYNPDTYQSSKRYIQIEPLKDRKQGFGSRDARRRDEFSSDVRTRQWREKLKSEAVYTAIDEKDLDTPYLDPLQLAALKAEKYREQYADKPELFQTKVPFYTYDIGREENASTPICTKCSRDTFYCPHRVGRNTKTLRRPGTAPTTYGNYGAWDDSMPQADRPATRGERYAAQKPKYGNVHVVDHFYDQGHIHTGYF